MKKARNPLGIPPVRLDRHRFQRSFHLAGFHEHRIKASFNKTSVQPLRQRSSLQANRCDAAVQIAQPARQNLGLAFRLCFFEDLPMLADHADRRLHKRYIQSDKQLHPVILHVSSIREWRQRGADLTSGNGGAWRRPRY